MLLVERAEQREHARGDGRARGRGVAGHGSILPLTGSRSSSGTAVAAPYRRTGDHQLRRRRRHAGRDLRRDRAHRRGVRRRRAASRPSPRLDYPPYRSSLLRHPTKDPHQADPEGVELWAPVFGERDVDPLEADLTIQHGGEPIGERIVRDRSGARRRGAAGAPPARRDLAGQRRRPLHPPARPAPGAARPELHRRRAAASPTTTGWYRFTTIKPGPYPWKNHHNAWRPAHIHFSLFGSEFTQRLVTQMYFPGDPLFALDPIYQSIVDPAARERLVATYDHDVTTPRVGDRLPLGHRAHRRPPHPPSRRTTRDASRPRPARPSARSSATRCRTPATRAGPARPAGRGPAARPRPRRRRRAGARRAARALAGRPGRRGAAGAGVAAPRRLHASPAGGAPRPTAPGATGSRRCGRAATPPFFALTVFARGLLDRLFTRAYLPGAAPAAVADPRRAGRRPRLRLRHPAPGRGRDRVPLLRADT